MDNSPTPTARPLPNVAGREASDGSQSAVVESLARLLAAAAIYPPTHPRIAAIVEPVLNAVRFVVGDVGRLVLHISEDDASTAATASGRRLRRDLARLGVSRIEIERDVTVEDLFGFARFLRQCVAKQGTEAGFRNLDFEALPRTVHVVETNYGAPTFGETPLLRPSNAFSEKDVEAVERIQVDPETVALVRKCILAAIEGRRDEFELALAATASPADGRRRTEAVANALKAWIERQLPTGGAAGSPDRMLDDAARTLPQLARSVDWAPVIEDIRRIMEEHLRDNFRAEAGIKFEKRSSPFVEAIGLIGTREDLLRALAEATAGAEPFGKLSVEDAAEHVSILLHMLDSPSPGGERDGVVRRLGAALGVPLGPRERAVLTGWMREVGSRCAAWEADRRLAPVLDALRGAAAGSLVDVLAEACAVPDGSMTGALWPHIAREALTGAGAERGPQRETLAELLRKVPETRVREEAARLTVLLAAEPDRAERVAASSPRRELYAVYEILLDMPRATGYAAAVANAFARHPIDHPAAGALIVLPASDERAHRFVARLIREASAPSSALRTTAVQTIVAALRALEPRRREEPWVAAAIHSLTRLASPESIEMLNEVRFARRRLVQFAWPAAARRAAEDALGLAAGVRRPGAAGVGR